MANEQDHAADQTAGSGFMMGLVTGAFLGAGLALLFAPRAGSELRGQIADSATSAGKAVAETYRQATDVVSKAVDDLASRGSQMRDWARQELGYAETKAGNGRPGV